MIVLLPAEISEILSVTPDELALERCSSRPVLQRKRHVVFLSQETFQELPKFSSLQIHLMFPTQLPFGIYRVLCKTSQRTDPHTRLIILP